MKLTTIFVFFLVLGASASTYSQNQKVTLNLKECSINRLFKEIKKQTGLQFMFNASQMKEISPVDFQVEKKQVDEVLREVFAETGYECRFEDGIIFVLPRAVNKALPQVQQITVAGKVTDTKGGTLPGVTVRIKGTHIGTATDANGRFRMDLPSQEKIILEFSFIGMEPQEVLYTGQKEISVKMQEAVTALEEVTVTTGIFNKSKESYTGAMSVVTEKELKMFGNRNLLTTLGNIDPAFNILTDNYAGSDPNSVPNIQIRGTSSLPTSVEDLKEENRDNLNTPLIILDGFEISLEKMMDMNENEVSTITILKDASATALYGSRAANGVVVITSKAPEEGKLRVTYRGDFTLEIPDLTEYHLLNAKDKLALEYAANIYRQWSDKEMEIYNNRLEEVNRGVDTYWLSKPLRTAVGHRHYVKLEGGSSAFRYGAGVRYSNTPGVMKTSGRENLVGEIKLSYTFKNLIFRNNLSVTFNKADNSRYGSFSEYAKVNPYFRSEDENGKLYKIFPDSQSQTNPLYNASLKTRNDSKYTDITNNFSIEWKPVTTLTLRGQVGVTWNDNEANVFKPADHTDFSGYTDSDVMRKGSYNYTTGGNNLYTLQLNANYNKVFAEKHTVYSGVNFSLNQNKYHSYNFLLEGFPNEDMDFLGAALQYQKNGKPSGSESISRAVGFVGNVNYAYASRYFVDGSVRVDGSSKFGSLNRFAPFWSVGAGWNIHNEKFWGGLTNIINRFKIRGSYGVTGSQNFSAYQAKMTYKYQLNDRYTDFIGAYLMGLGNENLKWQTTKEANLGLELAILNNRVSVTADIYRNVTDNLLSDMDLPYSNGFASYKENIGKVRNQGLELKVSGFLIRNTEREFTWSVTGSLVADNNKIMEISQALKDANAEIEKKTGSNPNFLYREGKSMNTIYAVRSLGIDPATGKELFRNKVGENTYTWDAADQVDCGVSQPKYRGNFSTYIRYKGLSLNASFAYRFGGQQYNQTLINRVENADYRYNVDSRVWMDRWVNPGDQTFFKGINDKTPTKATSRFVQDEKVLQCQNLFLTYDIRNKALLKKMKMEQFSVSANTSNLFYKSTVKQERGLNYPFSKQYSFTLTATF